MLLRMAVLDRIKRGEISLVFRRWRKPTVRSGGTLKTAIGVLRILDVREVRAPRIPRADVVKASFATKTALLSELAARDGTIFRIALEYAGQTRGSPSDSVLSCRATNWTRCAPGCTDSMLGHRSARGPNACCPRSSNIPTWLRDCWPSNWDARGTG